MSKRLLQGLAVALVAASPGVALAQGSMGGMGGMDPMQNQSQRSGKEEDSLPDVDEAIAKDAQAVFAKAEKAFADQNWPEAIAYFQHIRQRFPFELQLAATAELRLADIAFAREKWTEARGYYRSFVRFHPKHERTSYAAFRAGLCTYKEMPGDFVLFPPSTQKDQTEVRAAIAQMREFLRTYPQSESGAEARAVITACESRLAQHELYVAEFYARREKWKGTLLRIDGLLQSYPDSPEAPKALALSVQAHAKLGELDDAKKAFDRLVGMNAAAELIEQARLAIRK